jgi:hypothetical protein
MSSVLRHKPDFATSDHAELRHLSSAGVSVAFCHGVRAAGQALMEQFPGGLLLSDVPMAPAFLPH